MVKFNWKIAMAPIPVIDYIVVHELCHLKVQNHSEEFWQQVSMLLPGHKEEKNWLKNNSYMLRI